MSRYWLVITLSWLNTVSLQYIPAGEDAAKKSVPPLQGPYNYLSTPQDELYRETILDEHQQELERRRRTINEETLTSEPYWRPNLVDSDKTTYVRSEDQFDTEPENPPGPEGEKRNFSPWGGKRDKPLMEQMWTWKRTHGIREPSMPKRVRFSPWGGKRSGQMIYKPGSKASKIIFSTTVPELTRIVSNYSPDGEKYDLAGFRFIPSVNKRRPIRVLAMANFDRNLRDALPFKAFMEALPKIFRPGHPYLDVNMNKDGKRKVKFNAWGGKRSPPIIGPIWTPTEPEFRETSLDAVLIIRKNRPTIEIVKDN